MSEDVKVLKLGDREFAAEVSEGGAATEHRITFPEGFLDENLPSTDLDEKRLIAESLKYLMQQVHGTALPHDIDLENVHRSDPEFIGELRSRMTTPG